MYYLPPILKLVLTSYLTNIPLGLWRSKAKKFSLSWFVAIHLSIPLVFYLRITWGIDAFYIPLLATTMFFGHYTGSKLGKKLKQ